MTTKNSNQVMGDFAPDGLIASERVTLDSTLNVAGATTFTSTVSASGLVTFNSLKLVQTVSGTDDITGIWKTAAAPVLTIGMYYFTVNDGSVIYKVPCFPTT